MLLVVRLKGIFPYSICERRYMGAVNMISSIYDELAYKPHRSNKSLALKKDPAEVVMFRRSDPI